MLWRCFASYLYLGTFSIEVGSSAELDPRIRIVISSPIFHGCDRPISRSRHWDQRKLRRGKNNQALSRRRRILRHPLPQRSKVFRHSRILSSTRMTLLFACSLWRRAQVNERSGDFSPGMPRNKLGKSSSIAYSGHQSVLAVESTL